MSRQNLIEQILDYKAVVVPMGFDWPTDNFGKATDAELRAFLREIEHYLDGQS